MARPSQNPVSGQLPNGGRFRKLMAIRTFITTYTVVPEVRDGRFTSTDHGVEHRETQDTPEFR
jgi:hypothetical protein